VTSPSIGTIRTSCDSPHEIYITLTCTNNCTNPLVTASGNSPLIIGGLDPGITYSIIIHVFEDGQVVLRDQTVMQIIEMMSYSSGKVFLSVHTYLCVHMYLQYNYTVTVYEHVP